MQPSLTDFIATGQHPASQRDKSALLDACRSRLLSTRTTKSMQSNNPTVTPFGMSLSKCSEICEKAPKGKLLETLAAEHLAEEKAREATKPKASATPLIDRIVKGDNPLARAKPAPASKTPHSDVMAKLQGSARASYFRQHKDFILRESRI